MASAVLDVKIPIGELIKYQEITPLGGQSERIICFAWSKDDLYIRDKTIKICGIKSKENNTTLLGHLGEVFSVEWSSNGSELISGSFDSSIKIWTKYPIINMILKGGL